MAFQLSRGLSSCAHSSSSAMILVRRPRRPSPTSQSVQARSWLTYHLAALEPVDGNEMCAHARPDMCIIGSHGGTKAGEM